MLSTISKPSTNPSVLNVHVLLIDDEVEFVSTLAERLRLRGYNVTVATDGATGLAMLDKHKIDFVLLDMMLPGMRGTDILCHIRKHFLNLPVVLLTGNANTQNGIEGMKEGADGYLLKPIDINELLQLMTELLKGN